MPIASHPARNVCVPVLQNREIVPGIFLLTFEESLLAEAACPGQFVMLSIPHLHDPLLPRPFAVFNVEGTHVEVLYKKVGKGTGLLSNMLAGDLLRVLGPLGNGFCLPDHPESALVLAGGIGIASVHFLLTHLVARPSSSTTLLYGVRSCRELFPLEALEQKGLVTRVATEDGKKGFRGKVTDLLERALDSPADLSGAGAVAFVCGPLAMLKAVAGQLEPRGIKGQFSLESRMACGYGVCQGCAVPAWHGEGIVYRKVCTDGPVFAGEKVCWEDLR